MNKTTNFATDNNLIVNLRAESHSTWFGYSGVFLFVLWLAVSFVLPLGPAQAKPADTTPPTVPGTPTAGGAYTKVCNLNWTWGASSDSGSGLGGYQYILYKDSSYISSSNTTTASYTNGCFGSGVYALYVRAYDNAGNYSAYANGSIIIDTVPPTCSVSASGSTLTATCSDTGGSGCTQSTQTQTATATGTYTFTFSDNAGNSGSCSYAYTAPPTDTTPPTGSVDPAAGTNYSAYSYNVTASYTDASGVASITYCTVDSTSSCSPYITSAASSVVVTIDSPIITFCRFGTDTLGNSSAVACGTYYLRPTQPNTINLLANYNDGSVTIGWWDTATSESSFRITRTGPSNTTFSAPTKSGTGSTSYTDSSCPVGGTYTYAVAACNAAGCSAAISDSVGKPGCDTTPPSSTVNFNPRVNYTSASSSQVDLGCSDVGGSGCSTYGLYGVNDSTCSGSLITSGSYSGPVSTTINLGGQGSKAISAKFTDVAGNSSCVSQNIYVDTTPPSGSVSINNGAATTSSASVTLTLTCVDDTDPTIALAPLNNKFVFVSEILHWLGLNWIAKAALPGPNGQGGCQSYYVYTNNNCSGSAVSNGTAPQGGNSTTASTTLSSGGGTKYISVQYMDGAGNTSCAADSIELVALPTACTSVGVTSVVSGSGVTNITPVTFQCYGSSGGASNEYTHTYYLNGLYQGVAVNQPSYLGLTLGQGTYTDCIQAHNSAGYSSSTCGSMVVDTFAPTCGSWSPASSTPHASGGTTFTLSGSTDAGSGIATAGGACTTGPNNGDTCTVTISDNAANTRACTSPSNIISVPPTLSVTNLCSLIDVSYPGRTYTCQQVSGNSYETNANILKFVSGLTLNSVTSNGSTGSTVNIVISGGAFAKKIVQSFVDDSTGIGLSVDSTTGLKLKIKDYGQINGIYKFDLTPYNSVDTSGQAALFILTVTNQAPNVILR